MPSISRTPDVPELSVDDVDRIEQTVFCSAQPPASVDLIFIFGTTRASWSDVATLCKQYNETPVLMSGFGNASTPKNTLSQASIIAQALLQSGVSANRLLLEEDSTNTLENVLESIRLLKEHSIKCSSLLFCCKSHHSGRCYRTLRKHLPDTKLSTFTYDGEYDGIVISKETWMNHESSRSRVYGEYLRIQEYSQKGDIADFSSM